jgi:hypothetical protein
MMVYIVSELRQVSPTDSFFGATTTLGVFDNFEAANKCLVYYSCRDDQPKGVVITEHLIESGFHLDPFILEK